MGRYLQTYGIIRRQFGKTLGPIATFGLLQVRRAITNCGFLLDDIFIPKYRSRNIEKPVFILGNPRSGTTFLHKHLESTGQLCGFELWEMMFPSFTTRKVFSPFIDRLAALSPARHHTSEAHSTSLRDLETDDVLEFLNFFDGGFLWSYFLAWEDDWGSEQCLDYFEKQLSDPTKNRRFFKFLEACWKRNMHFKKRDRLIAKSSMLTLRIEELIRRYPDCRIIYSVRDPMETIPSGMSLISGVMKNAYDAYNRASSQALTRYNHNLYKASCHLYSSFYKTMKSGRIPKENLHISSFDRLMNDLENATRELLDFIEVEPSIEFKKEIEIKSKKQKKFKSKHTYSLEQYGLDEEQVRRDLSFVYNEYNVSPIAS